MQRQRDQLEEFTRVVSHDIRNPLGIVEGYLDMAERTGDPEHFRRCRDAVDRMESLIDDLLFLTREGRTIGGREEIGLAALADESWSFVSAGGAALEVDTDRVLIGDWSRLQQVFENLFRNAVEHGGADVTARVGDLPDGSGIYVEDDGVGIPEDERDEVLVDGYTTDASGTGLGLTIIQQVVSAHGWEIAVGESAEGGARFEISGMEFVESEPVDPDLASDAHSNGAHDGQAAGAGAPYATAVGTGAPADSDAYLAEIPPRYTAESVVLEWTRFLVDIGGAIGATRALRQYREQGWITRRVERTVAEHVRNAAVAGETEETRDLRVQDHRESLTYISRLAGDVDEARLLEELSALGGGSRGIRR